MALEKASCLSCGLAAHVNELAEDSVKTAYDESYALSTSSPLADKARAQNYAKTLVNNFHPAKRVLEIGCGSGNLLQEMTSRWHNSFFVGIDPALPNEIISTERTQYVRAFFDASAKGGLSKKFDLIFSINVIEHINSPTEFFALASELLTPDGQLAVICPAAHPPNVELMFYDHLHTFTAGALAVTAMASGLSLVSSIENLPQLGDFQLATFCQAPQRDNTLARPFEGGELALAKLRAAYLNAWGKLEDTLLARTDDSPHIAMFGAGQMAALIRAYAPLVWKKVKLLVMDNVDDAWQLDKPVDNYLENVTKLKKYPIILAVSPRVQAKLAERLTQDGLTAIRFDDLILS
ncbi:class I SAM-dependent methyltransferase [Paralcaligenes sp. KSB-10]|uniref:class I SAM-dependent methyltransferase n=1 Tax=Paralcaligenes sp. KSB-10 TaxID=2901142 RepID=UPI001E4335EB|nr:class I SAM-dependent methyltransferase [Paralcaligenes sp. KSB-10]UHL63248.1 class I SAM-dependent methyltransferase [Paralcaligenes sp. KSB-10]